ncbi:MAG: LUD domain-containing protein [Prosthecobacter sp.]|nr:LUD domain-containing protein [Prosthecobacter sp.]
MSTSRAAILKAVRSAPYAEVPLPDLASLHAVSGAPSLEAFTATLDLIGARWIRGADLTDAIAWVEANVPASALIASTVSGLTGSIHLATISDPHALDGIHTAVVPGRFGVCENGAVWLDEAALGPHRVLPFIAEHLVVVLPVTELVATMHQAYARLKAPESDFGVFLAGPSKTADIEQCLVVGAHGARSCTVLLLG